MFPVNRVPDILRRMEMNSTQAEAMKTCFGILAIMSREENNKTLIAKEGMEIILNVMVIHIDRSDVQEAGCDLLWSLAFNSQPVKEIIAKFSGTTVLVRALKRHSRSSDFLKSACGALSNICQIHANQEGVADQGGLQAIVGSIHIHQGNGKLLPFIFDAVASIIVNNEENARSVSALGLIPVLVASLSRHKSNAEVAKSGSHTLAILSDVKGQASKIAFAGGVPVILSLLDQHPLYADLHRVAAVVLLRMLQESAHVGKELCCHEGVRILLGSLEKGGAQQDTVAAVTHILYTITNPSLPSFSTIEPQLWICTGPPGETLTLNQSNSQTALKGVVSILEQYRGRRDVIRAACRLLTNLTTYSNVALALDKLGVLDCLCECVAAHRDSKDVLEAAAVLLKTISKKKGLSPQYSARSKDGLEGLLHLFASKSKDDDVLCHSLDLFSGLQHTHDISNGHMWNDSLVFKILVLCKDTLASFVTSLSESSSLIHQTQSMQVNALGRPDVFSSPSKITMIGKLLNFIQLSVAVLKSAGDDIFLRSLLDSLAYLADSLRRVDNFGSNSTLKLLNGQIEGVMKLLEEQKHTLSRSSSSSFLGNNPVQALASKQREDNCSDILANSCSPRSDSQYVDSNTGQANSALSRSHSPFSSSSITKNGRSGSFLDQAVDTEFTKETFCQTSIQPQHPLKAFQSNGLGSLLQTWPPYVERLQSLSNAPFFRINNSQPNCENDGKPLPRMHLCYESKLMGGRKMVSRCLTPLPYVIPAGGVGPPFQHSLTFDADFESGNLFRAVQVGDASYDLILRADVHTQGHVQWFYFAVANTHPADLVRLSEQGVVVPAVRVQFNLINFTKPDSLFNLGMRPVIYSVRDSCEKGVGWVRAGSEITYYPNAYQRCSKDGEGTTCYYTLSFTIEFHHPKDTVLVAYSYPYTLSDYRMHIREVLARPQSDSVIKKLKLCTTVGGEDCDLLVVTDFSDRDRLGPIYFSSSIVENNVSDDSSVLSKPRGKHRMSLKPALFISGRVHPGETPASWMMKGIIEFLVSDSPTAVFLRKAFVVFVVPILNPDGVALGNNRCSLAGVDLNRQWKSPDKTNHPTIFTLKMLMTMQRKIREIAMFIDLHGHSRKYNVFMYGCDEKKKSKYQVRAFPRYFANHPIGGKYVCFEDCSFHVKRGRESTARVVVAKDLGVPFSYTLEATFCGSNYGPLKNCHMNIGHLQEVGAALCDTMAKYLVNEGYGKEALTPGYITSKSPGSLLQFESSISFISGESGLHSTVELSETHVQDKAIKASTHSNEVDHPVHANNDTTYERKVEDYNEEEEAEVEGAEEDSEGSDCETSVVVHTVGTSSNTEYVKSLRTNDQDDSNFELIEGKDAHPPNLRNFRGSTASSSQSVETFKRSNSHTLLTHSIAGDVITNTLSASFGANDYAGKTIASNGIASTMDVINDG